MNDDKFTYKATYGKLTLKISGSRCEIQTLDRLLDEAEVQRSVVSGNPTTSKEVLYQLPTQEEVGKAVGILAAATTLLIVS